MQNSLLQALRAVYTVDIHGAKEQDTKLCMLPGIYSTIKLIQDPSSKDCVLSYSDPANLNNAGYACDQVADDGGVADGVVITSQGRSKYRDFLNSVQRVGMRCTEIVIQNKLDNDQSIFDQQIEVAKTVIGAKGGMDFITLQKYVSVNAYDRRKITIDLSGVDEQGRSKALELTPEVFMAINVPADSHFSMQFTFDNSVSGI
jgi:hypothetical protein